MDIAHQHRGTTDDGGRTGTYQDAAAKIHRAGGIRIEPIRGDGLGGGGHCRSLATSIREGIEPAEFEILWIATVVAAVAQDHLLVQRIAREKDLEIPRKQLRTDFDDLDHDRIAGVGEGFPIAEDQSHIAAIPTGGTEGIADHGSVGVTDIGALTGSNGDITTVDFYIGARHSAALLEGLQGRAEGGYGSIPFGFVCRVPHGAERLEVGEILQAQLIQIKVILAHDLIDELAHQNETSFGSLSAIEVKALLQVGRQTLEIGLSGVIAG